MSTPRILAFSGSLRQASFNQAVVGIAADAARAAGAEVTLISLRDFDLPLFNEDIEAESGRPEAAARLIELFRAHHGLLIGCPEYNSSISPALKNAIDWVSRPTEGQPPLDCFDGKVAGLVAASPGGLGGLRGLTHVRAILSSIKVIVHPNQAAVGGVHGQLNEARNALAEERLEKMVRSVGTDVAGLCRALNR
ncbi:MAG: NADPH-dependent FMN reductase [Phycisphaerales bacterium]